MKNKFKPAFLGIKNLLLKDNTIKIHLAIALIVCITGWIFHISAIKWLIIILCIGMVLVAEAFNSAIEKLCDLEDEHYNSRIKTIKDIAAGSVLIAALISVLAGIIIFLPEFMGILG